ncbi:serine/threonine-protein kinase [Streptomyces bauhiniae]|uniref:Serine/threonine protein kinase n=1 Tax=Streptomyces bauhiniae TaxID=2340725 RepID=A0A7K3QX32_9ACTN|nr:serine/threonine-protein kinase [Streptomyces bauhiniae]NEB94488.1 serine/threonine protein kinase [Streptomyces bauhiniae]
MQPLGADEPAAVGPYRLLGRLGSGGMGRVYLGRSAGGRTVAVKIVHPQYALDEEFRARFRREVAAARRVGGAWTAPVLDADPDAPVPWAATAYAAGPSLAQAVTAHGPLPHHTVRALGAGLSEALATVHALDLVHRDVKPSNVLLTLDGPLLIDFGIARATTGTASLTATGASVGSPGYMAPEQILGGRVTGAADVFSLGAVLAYAATGTPPFPGDSSAALLYKVVHEEPELGALDGELREIAAACLAKDPAGRPAPADLTRRLAPQGAASLITGGWLPGPLVEQVSRSAVQILNLEASADAPSGPVDFSSPAVAGQFGPAPVMTPAPETAPGKVSVSLAATSMAGERGRGRRMSCTVALAVAGALAAVSLGVTTWLHPGGEGGKDTAGSAPTHSAPTHSAPADRAGAIPARYLGTWEGKATALDGALPMGTFRVTVHQATVGKELGNLRQTDQLGGICEDILTLKQVNSTRLLATSTGARTNHKGCDPAPHEIRLTPTGDDLTYTSTAAAEGNPEARLSKVTPDD